MVIAIDPGEQFEYTLQRDRSLPEEERTVFLLRPLSYEQRVKLTNLISSMEADTGVVRGTIGDVMDSTLRAGLVGWRNLRDRKGVEVEFAREGRQLSVLGQNIDPPKRSTLARLHPHDQQELSNAITEVQRVTIAEGKG